MRRIMTVWLFCFCLSVSFAQTETTKTKIEEAVTTKGYLYKQEVFTVDNIPAFRIDAVKVTNLEKFSVAEGLRVVHRIQIGKDLKTIYNYLDAAEIDGLITSLQYMKTILKSKTVPGSYTEIKFTSQAGFQVMLATVLNIQNKLDWSFTVQTDLSNERTLVSLNNEDVDKLQKTLEQAKGKL